MSKNAADEILSELDSRINLLKEHRYDKIEVTGNQYEELNQAVSKVIGAALLGELEGLKTFVKDLH